MLLKHVSEVIDLPVTELLEPKNDKLNSSRSQIPLSSRHYWDRK